MSERKRTRTEERHYKEMLLQMMDNERAFQDAQLKLRELPGEWHEMDRLAPCAPVKRQLTIRLDEDLIRFYRRLGRGYQARVNGVLRAYMLGVLSKEIEGLADRDWKGEAI